MNRGKFFSLDLGASCLHEGISVFNYTDIFDADVIERKGQTTPRYPIFVSITPTSVKFILQYCVYLQNGNFVSFLDSIDGEINYQIRHMEEVLIELPLITTQGFSLASTLKRLYDTPFPIDLKEEKNYIKELIQRRYDEGIGQYASMRNRDENRENIHYSRLFIWDLYSEKEKKYKLCGEPGKYNKVLRKLVLDFFFDMMHSDVFKNSMYFDAMYSRFMSDYFCSAILHKSEFYYQRALVCDLLENNNLLISDSLAIYADNFDKAEAKWVKCILAPESDSYFEFEPKWFEPNKSEKKDNCFSKLYNWFVGNYKFQIYNSWFISAEEELQRIYYNEKNSIVSSSEDLCRIAQYSKNIEVKNISFDTNLIQQRRIDSSKWFIRRYNFDNAYRLSFLFPCANLLLILTPLLAFCVSIVFDNIIIGWGILGIIYSLFFSFTIGKDIFKSYFLCRGCHICDCESRNSFMSLFRRKIFILQFILQNLHLLLYPRLLASIAAAWLTIALSEDLYKAFFDFDLLRNWWVSSFLLIFILVFVIYEVNKIVPRISRERIFFRSLELMIISFAISLLVGLAVINFTGERMLMRSGVLPEFYRDNIIVRSDINGEGKPIFALNFDRIEEDSVRWNDSIIMNVYTHSPYGQQDNEILREKSEKLPFLDGEMSKVAIYAFANTEYEKEYVDRIATVYKNIDSLEKTKNSIYISDTIKGKFLLRHENDLLFKDLLEYVEYDGHRSIATIHELANFKFFILHDFLVQFAIIAMFIGVFINMIFEEKNVTEF